jgi:hypothetical protein
MGDPQNENAEANDCEREQGADTHQFAGETDRQKTRENRDDRAGDQRRDIWRAKPWMNDRREWRQQAVARHRIKDPRLAEQGHQNHRTQSEDRAELDEVITIASGMGSLTSTRLAAPLPIVAPRRDAKCRDRFGAARHHLCFGQPWTG